MRAATTDRSFATYLTARERDQLDAEVACLRDELDEMRDARDTAKQLADIRKGEIDRLRAERDQLVETIGRLVSLPPEQIADMHKVGYSGTQAGLGSPAARAQDDPA